MNCINILFGDMCFRTSSTSYNKMCGNTRDNFRFYEKLISGTSLDQLVGLALRQLGVVAGLHGVVAAALGLGTQVGGVAEHLGQRNVGVDVWKAKRRLNSH